MATTTAPTATATAGGASKARQTFHIQLNSASPAEINFKELVRKSAPATQPASQSNSLGTLAVAEETAAATSDARTAAKPRFSTTPSRPKRFDIIEHLEKRYGGGAVLNDSEEGPGVAMGFDRRDDDDLYDSEDSFIDDTELQLNIEEVKGQTKVKTKHSGFFVNAGDDIETLAKEDGGESDSPTGKTGKGKRGKKRSIDASRALKSFLDEWPDVASDWQPDDDIVSKLEVLRNAVRELTEVGPIPKVFPRTLDEPLRAVDRLVVEAHPNNWRVNGYFATLMTFLPYTKQYLKSNMLRLEARDTARSEKETLEKGIQEITDEIAMYGKRAETEPVEKVRDDILKSKTLGANLHALLSLQDDWISKENDYRQMLKTEDKKHMKECDYKQLNVRQERNRIFNRVLGLFAPGLIDMQSLRAMNKAAKAKAPRKSAQVKGPKAASSSAKRKVPEASPTAVKRAPGIKAFKSRMMDTVPVFNEEDFEEVE